MEQSQHRSRFCEAENREWFEIESNNWRGVLGEEIWSLTQDEKYLYCEVVHKNENTQTNAFVSSLKEKIRKYFRLDVSLADLYKSWSQADPLFQNVSKSFPGVRILDQDPVENVFSFICSSNNNIKRITNLVNHLCNEFGVVIGTLDDTEFYTFPPVDNLLRNGVQEKLRHLGFGYRAKYIEMSANVIHEKGGVDWLNHLRELSYEEAHSQILELPGVGSKVADCICLMSLNHLQSVPVDTHVFQIASREYLPHLKGKKSLTTKIYNEISGHFRKLFGSYAGWAHSC
ncbi:N-glycosylase/DNA lyase [Armadillidium nasatum]|uniref:N-glycosylase/DNA lyase n=1 Tax=Armadillidium nasatum TaxID=96803 RepID=A0A5N5TBH4_9CRUS|nr:N-glycosylase/DNA lyase [Armadillidium nasatum]